MEAPVLAAIEELVPAKYSGLRQVLENRLDRRNTGKATAVTAARHLARGFSSRIACAMLDSWIDGLSLSSVSVTGGSAIPPADRPGICTATCVKVIPAVANATRNSL